MGFFDVISNPLGEFFPGNGPWAVDFQRNYNFTALFSLYQASDAWNILVKELNTLPSSNDILAGASADAIALGVPFQAYLAYVSTLVKSITPPQPSIETTEFKLGSLSIEMPTRISLDSFEVVFMHDATGAVETFYRQMFLAATSSTKANQRSNGVLTFQALSSIAISLFFTRNYSPGQNPLSPIPIELPAGMSYYPKVFPVKMEMGEFNKTGEDISEIKMTFIRLPVMQRMDRMGYSTSLATYKV